MLLVVGGAEGVAELALVRGGGGPLTGSELGSTIMKEKLIFKVYKHFLVDITFSLQYLQIKSNKSPIRLLFILLEPSI